MGVDPSTVTHGWPFLLGQPASLHAGWIDYIAGEKEGERVGEKRGRDKQL